MFSRDGTRLAIGGGSWYGLGGIALHDLATRATSIAPLSGFLDQQRARPTEGSVSGIAFSADDRHLVASTWTSSHHSGPTIAFEVDGLALTKRVARERSGWGPSTGILALGVNAIVRVHGAELEDVIDVHQWPADLGIDRARAPQHLTSSRIVVVRGNAVTGHHHTRTQTSGFVPAGLIIRSLGSGKTSHVPAQQIAQVTAIGVTADDTLITGGRHGELDRWSWSGEQPHQEARIGVIPEPAVRPEGEFVWSAYSPASVVGICALANGRLVAVTAGGVLATWRDSEPITTWPLPINGTPRSIAAHPDRAIVGVGIKQGGFGRSASKVALVELDPEVIDPAWRTPRVLEIAATADRERTATGRLDQTPLAVLADALEEAGAPPSIHQHLRRHDRRLRCCWVLDALRATSC